ncbi:MAG: T9SS type A sorting domain-containing protein [Ignavibacteria bacterium]
MKSNIKILAIFLCIIISNNNGFAGDSNYKLTIQNMNLVSKNILEFDINLQNIGSKESALKYIMGQYFFDIDSKFAGRDKDAINKNLTCTIVKSELPEGLIPRNPSIAGSVLRFAVNSIPSKDNLPLISNEYPGTLIARVRIQASQETFSTNDIGLKWRVGPENPFTKIFSYADNKISEVQNIEIQTDDLISNNSTLSQIPSEYALLQNYPNPFNPTTNINYGLPVDGNTTLKIFDVSGREVASLVNEFQSAGYYTVNFNANNLSSGIYFYAITSNNFSLTKKMLLIK